MSHRPEFAIEVFSPNTADVAHGRTEDWVEVMLDFTEIQDDPVVERTQRFVMTRDGAELMIDQLHEFLHPWAGKTITETIFGEAVDATRRLLSQRKSDPADVGLARGLTRSLALLRNPYDPDAAYEAVKIEIMARVDLEEDR